ncbi:MAG: DNA-directed RNA polymerase subunit beta' [Anaerolineales bacterium]
MDLNDVKSMKVSLASPEQIHSWSYGEVTKPETINYRRLRPEKDGLFCEAIFGPTKDWQCYCGKYKKVRFRGIICDKCGVEVTHSRVRRERMGHIDLATPIAHIWYTRRSPSYLGLLLNISQRNLDRVLYYAQYIVTNVDENARERALRRLEDETERERQRLTQEANDQLAAIQAGVDQLEQEAQARQKDIDELTQQRRDQETEQIMSAATALREQLDALVGQAAPQDLVFEPSQAILARSGDPVTRGQIAELNRIVQEQLSRIELKYAAEREALLSPLGDEEGASLRDAERRRAEIETKLDAELEKINARLEEQRDELMGIRVKQLLNEIEYRELTERWGRVIHAGMGAEAIREIVERIDLEKMGDALREEIRSTRSKQRRKKAIKQLQIVEALRKSGNRPEWMILTVLPVIPPALRPMVQLDGGRFATSDLNDLYRRVVNRNNRLKHLISLQAPEVIVRNEKRMLQEAVDSLIDNSRRGKAISLRGRRQLKSLSDMLKGKAGRFRRNLLGKRVDYSGRSVIVVGPKLKLHQCGLPKRMALELFRPFVMQKLVEYNHAINVKGAKRLIEHETPEVWSALEEVIQTRPVLLNRAPTLHRLSIQAFEPILVEGSAIHLHPLVCSAFNADFDGDQMAVHVPLSEPAVREARELMLSSRNLLRPGNGEPEVGPSKDMVMGCYYLTMDQPGVKGEGKVFSSYEEVQLAYNLGIVHVHAAIKFLLKPANGSEPQLIDTTVGRVLFNARLPEEVRFVNRPLDKGGLKRLVADIYEKLGLEGTPEAVDAIKDVGFEFAMLSGITMAIDDLHVPREKQSILQAADNEVAEAERQYHRGLITETELYTKTVELWTKATEDVTNAVAKELDPYSSLGIMVSSGASKGGLTPIRQLAGMRGLMADPSGRIIEMPIRSNFREGLTSLEYFLSAHGSRKGLADTALRTADAGYFTRRLVDVAQDMIVNDEDCGTSQGIWITLESCEQAHEDLHERISGRFAAAPVVDPTSGEILVDKNEYIDEPLALKIESLGIDRVCVRSPLTCNLRHGVCARCYGQDLGRNQLVELGEAVGIIAAQSIGEPGTQLTLRTFHTGGVAGASDITQGLPRVQEVFEARIPRGQAIVAETGGIVEIRSEGDQRWASVTSTEVQRVTHAVPANYTIRVENGDMVSVGEVLATHENDPEIVSKAAGRVLLQDDTIVVIHEATSVTEYEVPIAARLLVRTGDVVKPGDMITEGSRDPHQILQLLGIEATREYMVNEIQRVYRTQGVTIADKHIEVIIRQMLRRVRVIENGDTTFLPGQLVDRLELEDRNHEIIESGGEPATAEPVVLGITKAALTTDSFLSAASFQHTISVLAEAAVEGRVDELVGIKESVLIGKLIPAGTGFRSRLDRERQAEATQEPQYEPLSTSIFGDTDEDLLLGDADEEIDRLEATFRAKRGQGGPSLPDLGLSLGIDLDNDEDEE